MAGQWDDFTNFPPPTGTRRMCGCGPCGPIPETVCAGVGMVSESKSAFGSKCGFRARDGSAKWYRLRNVTFNGHWASGFDGTVSASPITGTDEGTAERTWIAHWNFSLSGDAVAVNGAGCPDVVLEDEIDGGGVAPDTATLDQSGTHTRDKAGDGVTQHDSLTGDSHTDWSRAVLLSDGSMVFSDDVTTPDCTSHLEIDLTTPVDGTTCPSFPSPTAAPVAPFGDYGATSPPVDDPTITEPDATAILATKTVELDWSGSASKSEAGISNSWTGYWSYITTFEDAVDDEVTDDDLEGAITDALTGADWETGSAYASRSTSEEGRTLAIEQARFKFRADVGDEPVAGGLGYVAITRVCPGTIHYDIYDEEGTIVDSHDIAVPAQEGTWESDWISLDAPTADGARYMVWSWTPDA